MSYKEFEILMQKVILETIKKYNLFEKNNSVIVAVSGGADSMALLHFMKHFATTHQLRLIVAHVNHKKRENSEFHVLMIFPMRSITYLKRMRLKTFMNMREINVMSSLSQ